MTTNNEHLAHYGTKGMKWGQRKSPAEKKQAKADRFDDIMRGRVESRNRHSETNKMVLKAKADRRSATTDRGRQEAAAALSQAKAVRWEHVKNGNKWTKGEYAAFALFGPVGTIALQNINVSRWEKSQGR